MLKRVSEMMLESRCRRDMMPLSVKIRALAVSPRAQLVTHVNSFQPPRFSIKVSVTNEGIIRRYEGKI